MKRIVLIGMIFCMVWISNGCNTTKKSENISSTETIEMKDTDQKHDQVITQQEEVEEEKEKKDSRDRKTNLMTVDQQDKDTEAIKDSKETLVYKDVQNDIDSYMSDFSGLYANSALGIDSDSNIRIRRGTIDAVSTEGNVVNQYESYTGEIIRYNITVFGETGSIGYEYYKINENMLYVTELETTYSCPINVGGDIDVLRSQLREYVIKDSIIYYIDNYEEKILKMKGVGDEILYTSFEDLNKDFTETVE